mgnify:CR=1 FL=1
MNEILRDTGPLVSIVIPVYNGANYLAEAIDSALAQTWPNTEVIVVDDGSDDGGAVAAICARYESRIRYFHKVNGGVATAVNYGIQMMHGEFFSWLSHDDVYVPERIATMVREHAERSHARDDARPLVLFSDARMIDGEGQPLRMPAKRTPDVRTGIGAITRCAINGCSLLIPRDAFRLAGLLHPGLPTTQDSDMWQRLLCHARIEYVEDANVLSRFHPDQETHSPWHYLDANLNRSMIFDRLDAGEIVDRTMGLAARYRALSDSGFVRRRPGPQQDLACRLKRALHKQSVAILSVGDREFVSDETVTRLCKSDRVVMLAGQVKPDHDRIFERCRRLDVDLVWLLDTEIESPEAALEAMLACLVRHPRTAACLRDVSRRDADSILGPYRGALLEVAAFRDADGREGWMSLSHSLMRRGGMRRLRGRADVAFDVTTTPQFQASVLRGRKGSRVDRWTALCAYRLHPVRRLAHLASRMCDAMRHRRLLKANRTLLTEPAWLQSTFARLAAHRSAMRLIYRAVWGLSGSAELARLRLGRMHGLVGYFDPVWYASVYRDVATAGVDPLMHYLCDGRFEGRDPSPGFDARAYLVDHPDVARSGCDAALHYALRGRFEGRAVRRSPLAGSSGPKPAFTNAAVLVLFPADGHATRRVAVRLAAQLRRSVRTVLVEVDAAGGCRRFDERSGTPVEGQAGTLDDAVGHFGTSVFRHVVAVCAEGTVPAVELAAYADAATGLDMIHVGHDVSKTPQGASAESEDWKQRAAVHYVFSSDVAASWTGRNVGGEVRVVPMPDPGRLGRIRPWLRYADPGECCRVAVFGNLEGKELHQQLVRMLDLVKAYRLPYVFTVFGTLRASVPKRFGKWIEQIEVGDESELSDAVCGFNPHVAWVPASIPSEALFPLVDAAMSALPMLAVDTPDAREYLAGRPLTWLRPARSSARDWLYEFDRVFHRRAPDQWMPRYPLEGFLPRDKELCRSILISLERPDGSST